MFYRFVKENAVRAGLENLLHEVAPFRDVKELEEKMRRNLGVGVQEFIRDLKRTLEVIKERKPEWADSIYIWRTGWLGGKEVKFHLKALRCTKRRERPKLTLGCYTKSGWSPRWSLEDVVLQYRTEKEAELIANILEKIALFEKDLEVKEEVGERTFVLEKYEEPIAIMPKEKKLNGIDWFWISDFFSTKNLKGLGEFLRKLVFHKERKPHYRFYFTEEETKLLENLSSWLTKQKR